MADPQTSQPSQTDSTSQTKSGGGSGLPVQAVVADPAFQALPFQERIKVLQKVDPRFAALPLSEQHKAARKLDPAFVKQSKLSSFALGTSQEGREPIEPTKLGVTKWIMQQTGAGVWDAVQGVGQLLNDARREFIPLEGDEPVPAEKSASVGLVKSFTDAIRKSPQIIPALRDLWKSQYGGAAVAEQVPRAAGQYIGSEMLGEAVKGTSKVAGTLMEKGVKSGIQDYIAGAGKSAAEDLAAQTREAFIGSTEEVRAKNLGLKQKYDEAVKTATQERIQAEERYKQTVEKAQKEHAADELAAKQEYEQKLKDQQEDYLKKVARQERAHAKLTAKVERANAQKLKEHAEETKRVEEVNKAEAEKVGKRAELAQKIKGDSSTLGGQLKSFYQKAKKYGKELYAPVDEATEGKSVPSTDVAALVTHAEDNILRGSEENIKQFNDILKRTESEPELKEDEADSRGYSYREKLEAGEPLTFRDLQGYYEELGKKIYGPGSAELLSDVKNAMRFVRDGIGKLKTQMAREAGVGDELVAADKFHSQLQGTFNDMSPVQRARNIGQRAGSPVARAIRAVDPQYIRDPFLNPAYGDRALGLLKAYENDPVLGRDAKALVSTVEGIQKDFKEMGELPKKAKVEEAPAAPALKELPEKKELPEPPRPPAPPEAKPFEKPVFNPPEKVVPPDVPDYEKEPEAYSTEQLAQHLKELKRGKVRTQSEKFKTANKWDMVAFGYGLYDAVESLMQGKFPLPKAWAYILGHWGAGKLMEVPKINAWLTDITPADIAVLEKTYAGNPLGKAQAQAAMTEVLSKSGQKLKPSTITTLGKFLTKPQVQQIIKATVKGTVATHAEAGRKAGEESAATGHEYLIRGLDELDKELSPQ